MSLSEDNVFTLDELLSEFLGVHEQAMLTLATGAFYNQEFFEFQVKNECFHARVEITPGVDSSGRRFSKCKLWLPVFLDSQAYYTDFPLSSGWNPLEFPALDDFLKKKLFPKSNILKVTACQERRVSEQDELFSVTCKESASGNSFKVLFVKGLPEQDENK